MARISRCACCGGKANDFGVADVVCVNPKCRVSEIVNIEEWNATESLIRAARKAATEYPNGPLARAVRRFDKAFKVAIKEDGK